MATAAELLILIKGRDEASATINHVTGRLGSFKEMAQTAAGTFAGFLTANAAMGAMRSAWDAASGSILGFNSQMEQAQIGFTTMLGSGERANAFLGDLQKFAAQTPFAFPDLVSASQRMLAMGFSAEQVRPTLTAIGDAVAALGGNSETIGRVTTALGQMQAKGKVSAEEMLQLTEAGIPAWQMLADAIGVSVPEAMKLAERGAISSGQAIDAITAGMNQRFGGMMAKQSQTFAGAMSTIRDSLNMAVGTAFKPFFEMLSRGAVQLSGFLSSERFAAWSAAVTAALGGAIGRVGAFVASLQPLAAALLGAFREDLLPKLQQMADVFSGQVLPAVQALAGAVRDQLQPVFERIGSFVAEHKEIWGGVAIAVGGALVAAFAALAVSAGAAAVSMIAAAAPVIAISAAVAALAAGIIWLVQNWDRAVERFPALGAAAEATAAALSATWTFIRGEVAAFASWWSGIWPSVQEAAVNVFEALRTTAEAITSTLVAVWRVAGDDIIAIVGAFADYLATTWNNIKAVVSNAIGLIVNLINGDWSAAWDNAKAIAGAVVDQIIAYVVELPIKVGGPLLELAGKFLSWIKDDVLPKLPGALTEIVTAMGRWIWDTAVPWAGAQLAHVGGAIVDGIKAGIAAAWDGFLGWVKGMLDKLPEAVKAFFGISSPSKLMAEQVGVPLVEGIAAGIESALPALEAQLADIKGALDGLNPFGKTAAGGSGSDGDGHRPGRDPAGSSSGSAGSGDGFRPPASDTSEWEDITTAATVRGKSTTNAGGLAGLTQTTLSEGDWQVDMYAASANLLAASSQFLDLANRGAMAAGTDLMGAMGFTDPEAFGQWMAVMQREAQRLATTFAQAQGAFAGTSGGGRTAGDIMSSMNDNEFEQFLSSLPTGERERARAERDRWREGQQQAATGQQQAADEQIDAGNLQQNAADDQENAADTQQAAADQNADNAERLEEALEEAAAAAPDVPEEEDEEDDPNKPKPPAYAAGGVVSEFARLVNSAGQTIGTMAESGPEAIVPMGLFYNTFDLLRRFPPSPWRQIAGQAPALPGGNTRSKAGAGSDSEDIVAAIAAGVAQGVAEGLDGAFVQMDGQQVGRLVSRAIARDALLAGVNR